MCRVSCRGAGGPSPAAVTPAVARQHLAPGRHPPSRSPRGSEMFAIHWRDPAGWWSVVPQSSGINGILGSFPSNFMARHRPHKLASQGNERTENTK